MQSALTAVAEKVQHAHSRVDDEFMSAGSQRHIMSARCASGYKGVFSTKGVWFARIMIDGKWVTKRCMSKLHATETAATMIEVNTQLCPPSERKYVGVNIIDGRFYARITDKNGKRYRIGRYKTAFAAAEAYAHATGNAPMQRAPNRIAHAYMARSYSEAVHPTGASDLPVPTGLSPVVVYVDSCAPRGLQLVSWFGNVC